MKKFTKISLIVVAALAGIGILLCGIASLMGGESGIWKNGELVYGNWHVGNHGIYYQGENGDRFDETDMERDSGSGAGTSDTEPASLPEAHAATQEISLAEVENIRLDIDAAELKIETSAISENIGVELLRGKEQYYSCFLEDNTLTVSYDTENYHFNNSPEIVITIPKGASFDTVTINTGAMAGEISFEEISCKNMELNVGAGEFDAEKLVVTEELKAVIGAGSVEIDDGEYRNVILECGMGSLTLSGKVTGDIKGSCGMGEMALELYGKEADYNYNISCELGQIEVNGETYSNFSGTKKTENTGAVGTIELDCGMGSIDVEFK
ncbi:MAG: DUF4097 family beta strand repeat protein [Roseburia sp.]|nr:DUF4097 family beta strand repeat protein [Roseburia sp.]